jgi:hypothetical protein
MPIVYKPSSKEVTIQVVEVGAPTPPTPPPPPPPPKEVEIPSWAVGLAIAGVVAAVVYASRKKG